MLLVGLIGKKCSGKTSICNFLQRNKTELGFTDVRKYSFAGPLKELCINILGLSPEQVYGTEEQKNSLTRYKWEDLPHYYEIKLNVLRNKYGTVNNLPSLIEEDKIEFPIGFMTAREVLQQVGTEIFRRMYCDIWAEACIRHILKDTENILDKSGVLCLIDDMRFPNEVSVVKRTGGKTVKLTRDIYSGQDQHTSETMLDADKYDWSNFDAIIKNSELTLTQQNDAMAQLLSGFKNEERERTEQALDLYRDER